MREIKFRAWDESNKIMHFNVEFIRGGADCNDWIIFKSDKQSLENEKVLENPYFAKQIKIMQYTEFKDKNKEPIYFGDIVYIDHYDAYYEIKMVRGYIACVTVGKCKRVDEWSLYEVLESHKVEVVGNKFKNPELLK